MASAPVMGTVLAVIYKMGNGWALGLVTCLSGVLVSDPVGNLHRRLMPNLQWSELSPMKLLQEDLHMPRGKAAQVISSQLPQRRMSPVCAAVLLQPH